MSQVHTVGRGTAAQIKIPKTYDTVGKVHLSLEVLNLTDVRITDLKSTNGTFVLAGKKWDEVKGERIVGLDMAIMLGDYQTTPRNLLAEAGLLPASGSAEKIKYRSRKEEAEPPPLPVKKRSGPRRNEFGEIVHE